jgi:DNA repair exonuclease SbcCD ATPase subunit
MSAKQKAYSDIVKISKMFSGLIEVGKELEKIGSYERAASEAESRLTKAQKLEEKAKGGVASASKKVKDAESEAEKIIADAKSKASLVESKASAEARAIVVQAAIDAKNIADDTSKKISEAKASLEKTQKANLEKLRLKEDASAAKLAKIDASVKEAWSLKQALEDDMSALEAQRKSIQEDIALIKQKFAA